MKRVRDILRSKKQGRKLSMVTCYDATMARLVNAAQVDMVLVGDSLGMVVKGEDTTLNVSVAEVAYHTSAVASTLRDSLLVADLPFMSYQPSVEIALQSSAELIRAGAQAVKLEGGASRASVVEALVDSGIPVMGHVGLLPQSFHAQSGFRVQGKSDSAQEKILHDAKTLEAAGAFSIVIEGVPSDLGAAITQSLNIPTIGIGAGVGTDGQVLVLNDILGLNTDFKPKFVRHYLKGEALIIDALKAFKGDVESGEFPSAKESFSSTQKRKDAKNLKDKTSSATCEDEEATPLY